MKIAVCGKGGSGKSVTVSLLADVFKSSGKRVIVLDSDESNTNLFWMLGLNRQPKTLMEMVGGRSRVKERMVKSGYETNIWGMEKIKIEDVPGDFVSEKGNVILISSGKISQSFEGCACPIGALTREFLKKLKTDEQDVVLIDMEAGIEHFGRGIEENIDKVVCVVEPSLESVNLARRIKELSKQAGSHFSGAIINKSNPETEKIIRERLKKENIPVLGTIRYCKELELACLTGGAIKKEMAKEIENIAEALLKDP